MMAIKLNDDDDSSENGDDDFICDRRDDHCDSGDDICCETPVHAQYHFKAGHLERLMKKHHWFVHNATTGLSTCLACHSIPNAKGRNSRCKLRDGTLIDSKHISFALTRHESEPSPKDARKVWLDSRQPQVNSNGRRQGPVPASVILENVPRPVLDR